MFTPGQVDIVRLFKNTTLSSELPPEPKKIHPGINHLFSIGVRMARMYTDTHESTRQASQKKSKCKAGVWKSLRQLKSVGLENLGNTCYVNCVLQALFVTQRFSERILSYDASKTQQPVLHALQALFQLMTNLENRVVSTSNFVKLTNSKQGQQDSSEYLMALFEILHKEDAQRFALAPDTNAGEGSSNSPETTTDQENQSLSVPHCSALMSPEGMTIIQSIFGGQIQIDIKCLQCGKVSSRTEFFTELPVFLPEEMRVSANKPLRLEELFHTLFSPEKLTENNRYDCQKCQTLQDGIRIQQLTTPPQNLILILNRFKYNQSTNELQKHMRKVYYSEYLELPVASDPPRTMKYKIYAAIVHVGSDVGSGHYYTLIEKANNQWWRMDDESVSRSALEKLNQLNAPETPYILFYHDTRDLAPSSFPSSDSAASAYSLSLSGEKRAPRSKIIEGKDYFNKNLRKKRNSAYKKSLNYVVQLLKDVHKK